MARGCGSAAAGGTCALVGLGLGWTWRGVVAPLGSGGYGLVALVVACALAIAARHALERRRVCLGVAWATCVLGTAATAVLCLGSSADLPGWALLVADLCAGTCISLTMLLWAGIFARWALPVANAGLAAAYVCGALAYAAVGFLPVQMGWGVALALPLVGVLLLILALDGAVRGAEGAREGWAARALGNAGDGGRGVRAAGPSDIVRGVPWRAVAVVAVCNFAAGANRVHTGVGDDMVAMGVAGALMAAIAWFFARRHSVYQIYRAFVPVMMAGLFVGAVLGRDSWLAQAGVNVAYAFSGAVLMLYVCDAARRFGGSALGMYALCRLIVRLAFSLGTFVSAAAVSHAGPWGLDVSAVLYGFSLLAIAVALFFWLSSGASFVGTDGTAAAETVSATGSDGAQGVETGPVPVGAQSARELMGEIIGRRCAELAAEYRLSKREAEVLELLAWGGSSRRVEEQLCVSSSTAKTHIRHIYAKMGIHTRDELDRLVHVRVP